MPGIAQSAPPLPPVWLPETPPEPAFPELPPRPPDASPPVAPAPPLGEPEFPAFEPPVAEPPVVEPPRPPVALPPTPAVPPPPSAEEPSGFVPSPSVAQPSAIDNAPTEMAIARIGDTSTDRTGETLACHADHSNVVYPAAHAFPRFEPFRSRSLLASQGRQRSLRAEPPQHGRHAESQQKRSLRSVAVRDRARLLGLTGAG